MKVWYRGRLVDSYAVPHRNRSRYEIRFYWSDDRGEHCLRCKEIAVPDSERDKGLEEFIGKVKAGNPGFKFHKILVKCTGADIE